MSKIKIETSLKHSILNDNQIDTNSTKLYDYDGDLEKRWAIVFRVWDFQKNAFVRRFDYDVNKLELRPARYSFAKKRIKEINKLLADGLCLNADGVKIKKRTIEKAFSEIMELKSVEYAKRTRESVFYSINDFLHFMKVINRAGGSIDTLDKSDLLKYRDYLLKEKKVTTRTVNNYSSYINIMVNSMIEREWLSVNPFVSVKKLRVHDTMKNREISPDELSILIPELKKNKALWLYVQFIYYCWLRPREISLLKIGQIDLTLGKISMSDTQNTKNKKTKFIDIPEPFLIELRSLGVPSSPNQFFFAHDGSVGKLFGYENFADNRFSYYHRDVCKKLDLSEEVYLYGWKRTGVCAAYRAGVGIYEIMRHGRWSDLAQVQTYLEKSGLMVNSDIVVKIPKI